MTYLERISDLYAIMAEGRMMDAFEKYYADNVVMIEPDGGRTEGKDANRKRLTDEWLSQIESHNGGGLDAVTSNEEAGVTMAESWGDFTFKDGNRMKVAEVAVQKWEGDQIVEERFYYDMSGMK